MLEIDGKPACDAGAPVTRALLPPRLGRYEIESVLGSGMMGVVYKAWDPLLGRPVALKVLRRDVSQSEDERSLSEQRFLREASLAAALCHPNIVVVHDYGTNVDTGAPFIAFEYLEGHTLAERGTAAQLDWRDALQLAARLAHALHHAHRHGTIHRDIKPANVMVLPSGEPKILDFGIARPFAGQLTAVGESWGTPAYMSPEQATAGEVDARSDLFSLGSMLYELLTGRRAFGSDGVVQIMSRVMHEDPLPPTCANAALPAGVDTIVARALAKDPGQRYPDGQALAEDLEDVAAGRPVRDRAGLCDSALAAPEETGQIAAAHRRGRRRAQRRGATRRMGVWAAGVALGAGVAVAVMLGRERSAPLPAPPPADASPAPAVRAEPAPWGLMAVANPATTPNGTSQGASERRVPQPHREAAHVAVAVPAPPGDATEAPVALPHRPHLSLLAPSGRPGEPLAPPAVPKAAHVTVSVRHGLESGQLKLWVDDRLVLESALASTQTRKLLFLKRRAGRLNETFEVPAGERHLRLEVVAQGATRSAELRAQFESGQTRVLEVKLGGKVALRWKS